MRSPLTIPRPLATRLLFEAQKRPDEEVCGLLAGRNGQPQAIYPITNTAPDRATRFEMDAQEQVSALRQIRQTDQELIAVYHSHPAAPPEPSARDIAELGYPDALLLIISLNIKGVLEMRGWFANRGQAEEVVLRVMD